MKLARNWLELDEVASTQQVAADFVRHNDESKSIVFAHDQIAGKGRFGRGWLSTKGESLTMSLIFWDYADWPKPWLVGIGVALALAECLDCQVRWPNDLTFGDLKTGGILTEIYQDREQRRVPVVGVGLNLLQHEFPHELPHATSVRKATGRAVHPRDVADHFLTTLDGFPEPREWSDIGSHWVARDTTPGKHYKLPDGQIATAIEVTADGALRCTSAGFEQIIFAADAIFG